MAYLIDFHTHAFPDSVAAKAIPALEEKGNVKACLDGTVAGLLRSMDKAGIDASVLCSIATRPSQFDSILNWSEMVRSARIIPFPSVHPDDADVVARIGLIRNRGFKGVKMHPYYQEFCVDEERMYPIYEAVSQHSLALVMHTGFDIGFPRDPIASPARIARVLDLFPDMKLVLTHMGAWDQWGEVEERLLGKPVWMECSYSFNFMTKKQAVSMLNRHPCEYLLFGSDSPWGDQVLSLETVRGFSLSSERESAFLGGNAARLLGLPD